jgi:hypothetical protein
LNLGLSIILIAKIGLLGSAISFSVSKVFINTLNVIQNKRLFNLFPYGKLHFLLIGAGIPIYFIGSMAKDIIHSGTIINLMVVGVISYLLYLGLFLLMNKESAKKLLLQLRRKNA